MPTDAHKVGPTSLAARSGTTNLDTQDPSPPSRDHQAQNLDWWTPEFQRAVDILTAEIYRGLRIQIIGQAGCGYHPPTDDAAELERFAREVGLDASYSIVTGNGRVSFPVPLGPPMGNGDGDTSTPQIRGRVIA